MRFLWSRVECEAAVGSNVRSVPFGTYKTKTSGRMGGNKQKKLTEMAF